MKNSKLSKIYVYYIENDNVKDKKVLFTRYSILCLVLVHILWVLKIKNPRFNTEWKAYDKLTMHPFSNIYVLIYLFNILKQMNKYIYNKIIK